MNWFGIKFKEWTFYIDSAILKCSPPNSVRNNTNSTDNNCTFSLNISALLQMHKYNECYMLYAGYKKKKKQNMAVKAF